VIAGGQRAGWGEGRPVVLRESSVVLGSLAGRRPPAAPHAGEEHPQESVARLSWSRRGAACWRTASWWCRAKALDLGAERLRAPGSSRAEASIRMGENTQLMAQGKSRGGGCMVLLARDRRRRIRHVAVTTHPTAAWTTQQLREAFPWDEAPRYLIHDRDHAFDGLKATAKAMGIEEVVTAPHAPVAKSVRRAICGISAARVFRSRDRVQRSRRANADAALLLIL
jgi:hypothetical protein